jgi:hypothetical protein
VLPCRLCDTETNGSARPSVVACRRIPAPVSLCLTPASVGFSTQQPTVRLNVLPMLATRWLSRFSSAGIRRLAWPRRQALLLWEAHDYGVQSPTWSPACHEQLSWRFHWWRHSHSVPVRWHRGLARAAVVVEQAVRAAHPVPQQAAREAVRAATALLNHPAAKAVRLAILLLNRPAVRAKIALIPQGRELGLVPRRGACADAEPTARLDVLSWLAAEFRCPAP